MSRPVVLKFVFGKGLQKRRRESDDTARFIAEQVTLNYAEREFTETKAKLSTAIIRDVRQELSHLQRQFSKFVFGNPITQRGLRGRLTTIAQGANGNPSQNLGSTTKAWPSLTEKYVKYNKQRPGRAARNNWFENSGDLKEKFSELSPAGETLFEEIFGPVSVTIRRNIRLWGQAGGAMTTGVLRNGKGGPRTRMFDHEGLQDAARAKYGAPSTGRRTTVQAQIATVSVRALGSLNPGAITRESLYGPGSPVNNWDQESSEKLAGRASRYRPTLEPFLEFFLTRSLAHAVSERLNRGSLAAMLTRAKRG